jgi:hypothetical protein
MQFETLPRYSHCELSRKVGWPTGKRRRPDESRPFDDDGADEIHCEYIGTNRWLVNVKRRHKQSR